MTTTDSNILFIGIFIGIFTGIIISYSQVLILCIGFVIGALSVNKSIFDYIDDNMNTFIRRIKQ